MIEAYIFDLDGTLIDSGEDIADGVNAALAHFGYFTLDTSKILTFIGDGAEKLISRSLSESTRGKFDVGSESGKGEFERIFRWYVEFYKKHPVTKTTLYAGIPELLKTLRKKGRAVGLLTNKPKEVAVEILEKLGISEFFDAIVDPSIGVQKPDPRALWAVLSEISKKLGREILAKNAIMVGDSAVDVRCGKEAGSLTALCRDGLGNTRRALEEKPDFSFAIASEIEKFIDILSSDSPSEIQKSAMKGEIPIVQDEGSEFICSLILENGFTRILEIGTAIGYSAIKFAELSPNVQVVSIEIDGERFNSAKRNVEEKNLQGRIRLLHADALEVDLDGEFDLIFIDAAKAQYVRFFEKFSKNLAPNGAIVSDNLSFHGMVEDPGLTKNDSTRQLVKKIRRYIEFLKANGEFSTEFYKVGDGISVSRRR